MERKTLKDNGGWQAKAGTKTPCRLKMSIEYPGKQTEIPVISYRDFYFFQ